MNPPSQWIHKCCQASLIFVSMSVSLLVCLSGLVWSVCFCHLASFSLSLSLSRSLAISLCISLLSPRLCALPLSLSLSLAPKASLYCFGHVIEFISVPCLQCGGVGQSSAQPESSLDDHSQYISCTIHIRAVSGGAWEEACCSCLPFFTILTSSSTELAINSLQSNILTSQGRKFKAHSAQLEPQWHACCCQVLALFHRR